VPEALWLAEDAAAATVGRLIGQDSWIASGIAIDSRALQPGDLFVALKAERDGHAFLANAFAQGAAAALVSEVPAGGAPGPLLLVDDTLSGLVALGQAARRRSAAKRLVITGSVGKTSTKEAAAVCLAPSGPTHASVKSFNNHWGVPLTLARMPPASRFAVFEAGMNHRHELAPLTAQIAPDVAMVTWIAPAHIENLGTLEAIADEKGDIYSGLGPDGVALVPAEAPCADRLLAAARRSAKHILRFGRGPECEARLLSFSPTDGRAIAEAEILGQRLRYRIGAEGTHWALNTLAALAAVGQMGADIEAAAAALADLEALPGRGAARTISTQAGRFTLVDDAYNANPTSVGAALETLSTRPGQRRIAVLGDMLELGPQEAAFHAGLLAPLTAAGVDLVFCAGPRMAALWSELPAQLRGGYAPDAATLVPQVIGAVQPGDVVLVKGSNGANMVRVVDALAALAVS
jgi:UDP-N-acetylmuramoyl-tripeptide--D-alanyl-D-alanine ligase